MAAQSSNGANAAVSLFQKLNELIAGGSLDYHSWRSLILEIETASPEDINTISLAYDSFLSRFPLCHWHLEKYAYHKAKLCGPQEAISIYEQGVGTAMYSVGFWVDYFTFGTACFEDPEDVRRLFKRAVSFVGKDYFCHVLWDKYLKYEFNQKGWSFLAQSYIEALRFPTKKLHFYYDNFKQFVANLEEETEYEKIKGMVEQVSVPSTATEISADEISLVIKDLLESSDRSLKSTALEKYRSIGEELYHEARQLNEKIKCFETKIVRRYFHNTPIDDDQLNNWHLYLDFIEKQDNLDLAIKLYERCLIPCASYPEFWIRYVEFLQTKGGLELAISALDRATQIFLKDVAEIHLFSARFKEHIGDVAGARAALVLCDIKIDSSFIENIVTLANLERRLGNSASASATYKKALEKAKESQKLHVLPSLYSQFAWFTFLITGSAAAARDVLIEGVQHVPRSRFLLEELIKFAMTHKGARQVNIIESVVADAISPGLDEYEGLNVKDQEHISCLFLEFVNLCGTIYDIRKAWNRHIRLFPQFLRKHSASRNYLIDLVRDKKRKHDPPLPNQQSKKLSPRTGQSNSAKETAQVMSTKAVVLFNNGASGNNEPAYELSCQSREGKLQPMVDSAELADQTKENAFSPPDSGQDHLNQFKEKPAQMDVCDDLAKQSKENALSPHKSAYEVGKSTVAIESGETSHSRSIYDQLELDHEGKQQTHPVSLDNISLNSEGNESQELAPMSCDEYETNKDVPASSESMPPGISKVNVSSFSSPKSIQTVESPQVHNELERDGSVSCQQEPSGTRQDSIEVDHMVSAPGHAQDREHRLEQSLYHDNHPVNALDNQMHMNLGDAQQDSASQKNTQSQLGVVQEDISTDQNCPTSTMTMLPPVSSQPVSYPQQNTNQITSPRSQHQWQTQQSLAMNQMLQYYYQQQQLLQQQYQQQLHMQHPYYQVQPQYTNQQPDQQHNQQHMQPAHQQQYVQQQQHQSLPYQLQQQIPSFPQSQQSQQVPGHGQLQQGQEPYQNLQQAHEKQQSQDLAYQAHQFAYQQHAAQGQHLLLQQYQQYQGYQQQQQQLQEQNIHQHPPSNQQDEFLQQHHQKLISEQNPTGDVSQNQQGSKTSPRDYGGAARPSESPHLRVQSPQ